MLAPARPRKGEPDYDQRLERYREQREQRLRHPEDWGFVLPPGHLPAPAPASEPRPEQGRRRPTR